MSKKPQQLYFTDPTDWINWLEQNFEKETEAWLEYPKKAAGKPRIIYNDAVEVALCFGWIDSTVKSKDELTTMQRFTKRRPKALYSQANKERLKWLNEQGLIHPSLQEHVSPVLSIPFDFPEDILNRLKASPTGWKNFQQFSPAYNRIRIAYIDAARKRPEEFEKRLSNFLAKTEANKMIKGYGGIDKYY